jgi:hypothetical protein
MPWHGAVAPLSAALAVVGPIAVLLVASPSAVLLAAQLIAVLLAAQLIAVLPAASPFAAPPMVAVITVAAASSLGLQLVPQSLALLIRAPTTRRRTTAHRAIADMTPTHRVTE